MIKMIGTKKQGDPLFLFGKEFSENPIFRSSRSMEQLFSIHGGVSAIARVVCPPCLQILRGHFRFGSGTGWNTTPSPAANEAETG